MATTFFTLIKILIFPVICLGFILNTQEAAAKKTDDVCGKVETVFARGSGQDLGGDEYRRFRDGLNQRLKGEFTPHHYELGTESYYGDKYPAVDVGNIWNGNALGAAVSGGLGMDYGKSVQAGAGELISYLYERNRKCKSAGSYYILGGYSQGAQVVGQVLGYLSEEIRDRIVFVGLFGDPKIYFPEGDAFFNPPMCSGKGYSSYRRGPVIKCTHFAGSLSPRKPYLPSDMKYKVGVWCYREDFVCGSSPYPWVMSGHGTYKNSGLAIDIAANEAAAKLKLSIENEREPEPGSTPNPTPAPPKPTLADLIDDSYHLGQGTAGQNVVFVVDIKSEGVKALYPQIKQYILDKGQRIIDLGGQFTMSIFGETYIPANPYLNTPGQMTPYATALPFLHGQAILDSGGLSLDNMMLIAPGSLGSPLMAVQRNLDIHTWRNGATKAIILITDQKNLGTTDAYGNSVAAIAKRALAIDPVNVYPLVTGGGDNSLYELLAEKTSGQVVTFDGSDDDTFRTAADNLYDKIENRPVPFLKNTEYIADVGQEVTFDASDSYVIDSTITRYDWDFDGDNVFDQTTTIPTVDHIYSVQFDGRMQVRVMAANGLIANMSAIVKIGTYVPPVLPSAPMNLKATVIETVDNISKVELMWDPPVDVNTSKLALSVNGITLGVMTPDRTSIIVTDVDRSFDNDFGIAGVASDGAVGQSVFVTLAMIESGVADDEPVIEAPFGPVGQQRQNDEPVLVASVNDYDVRVDLNPATEKSDILGTSMNRGETKQDKSSEFAWYWLALPLFVAGSVLYRLRTRLTP